MGEVPDREGQGAGDDDELDDAFDAHDEDLDDGDDGDDGDHGDGGVVDDADDDREDLPALEPSALPGILEFLARGLVDEPDRVAVRSTERDGGVTLQLSVDQPDMGKVIGRGGRTARALRTLMRAAGVRAGVHTHVEIVEGDSGE